MLYTSRMFMIVVATVFFSLVYLETRQRVQSQALQRFLYTNFVVGVSCNLAISVVFAGNIEFNAIKREVKDGQYSPVAQFLAGQLINIPAMACLGLAALMRLYLIGDMPWSSFGLALLSMSANLWAFEGMGQLFSLMPNVWLGNAAPASTRLSHTRTCDERLRTPRRPAALTMAALAQHTPA
jgi:hypothetical protein